jgi:mRNA-degrading endonuclease RelE of RelBE toxin-antitoxin system
VDGIVGSIVEQPPVTNLDVGKLPRPPAASRLVGGAGEWWVRTGDYREIYEIHDDELLVLVLRIAHRREAYER